MLSNYWVGLTTILRSRSCVRIFNGGSGGGTPCQPVRFRRVINNIIIWYYYNIIVISSKTTCRLRQLTTKTKWSYYYYVNKRKRDDDRYLGTQNDAHPSAITWLSESSPWHEFQTPETKTTWGKKHKYITIYNNNIISTLHRDAIIILPIHIVHLYLYTYLADRYLVGVCVCECVLYGLI